VTLNTLTTQPKVFLIVRKGHNISQGVHAKYTALARAAEAAGFQVKLIHISRGLMLRPGRIYEAVTSLRRGGYLYVRSLQELDWIFVPVVMFLRIRSVRTILEVPTPPTVLLKEISDSPRHWFIKVMKILATRTSFPFITLFYESVVNFGLPGGWIDKVFSKKSFVESNWVDTERVSPSESLLEVGASMRILCIGTLAPWHGFDRLLHGLAEQRELLASLGINVVVDIVGDGDERANLEKIVFECGLDKHVCFHGNVPSTELESFYCVAHIGCSSLGLHRIGLRSASPLKAKEYCAAGLPVLVTKLESDFKLDLPFTHVVESDETNIDIVSLIHWRSNLPQRCSAFAISMYAKGFFSASSYLGRLRRT